MQKMMHTIARDTHYEWARSVLLSRKLDWPIRELIAACTLIYGIAVVLLIWEPGGLSGHLGRLAGISAIVFDFTIAALWLRGPWPTRPMSFMFIAWSHIGTAITLSFCADWNVALRATLPLVLVGIYVTMLHRRAVLIVHLLSVVVVSTSFAIFAVISEPHGWAGTFAAWITVVVIAVTTSIAIRNPWMTISTFAQDSLYDPLTGALNRHGLQAQETRIPPKGMVLAVALADIDSFKAINDSYGHSVGDKLITAFCNELRLLPRVGNHLVVRTGGDEFVVVAVVGEGEEAALAQKIVESATAAKTETVASASVGLASWNSDYFDCVDGNVTDAQLWDFVNEADQLMYDAKRSGGNDFRIAAHR